MSDAARKFLDKNEDWEKITKSGFKLIEAKEHLERLLAENAELKKYLKHARDDKAIRLGEIEVLEAKVAEQSQQRTQALGKLEDASKCDLCDCEAEYRQCQSCMNEKFIGSHTDEEFHKLETESAELREALIELLRSNDCFGDYGIEIPEELSARLDIGLNLAHYIVDILTPKETTNENPPT